MVLKLSFSKTREQIMADGNKIPQVIAALSVCLGAVAAGTILGWTANISQQLKNGDLNNIQVDDTSLGWIGSFTTLGAMVMCFPTGFFCDLIGRKFFMLLTVIPLTIGWLLIIFSQSLAMIYVGRFLTGIGGGVFCIAAPLYTSEISQKEIRGTLGTFFQLLLTVGILISYVLGAVTTPKTVSIVNLFIPIVFGLVFIFQPRTPVYLMKRGKEEEARKVLKRLRGSEYTGIDGEISEIKNRIERDKANKEHVKEVFARKHTKRALLVCFGLMFFQQLSGINAVIFYTSSIFHAAESSMTSTDATILVGVIQVIATLVASLSIDRFGRKILLISSGLFMAIGTLLLGIFFSLKDRKIVSENAVKDIAWLPILALCLFILLFSFGYGPIPWMIQAEIIPEEIKSNAASAAGTFNWFLAFIVTKFYLDVANAIQTDVTFYGFTVISAIGTVFVFFCLPETKGKTFEEIEAIFS